ncbi:hypothetical protein [Cellulomonas oligotrophica]|uniref:Uncharacterized protein n=1 Tax=Cellulomonas oligotrophica TaxID=931536 RepID=A0A7Y9K0B8_9CELL|nr:hypothetical protein [Cellulomonas oligotrophica]NYD87110.1 hypothetical protein [Cellulomonas oligotrophica]GIG32104.1 hypothetical protein Col01nite_12630 [Cellulomonas oligotrophica]
MTTSFPLLRDALTNLALPPERQRQQLAGAAVPDELALDLDLDIALRSVNDAMERAGVRLAPAVVAAVEQLNDSLAAPPGDGLWDDAALAQHPVWISARQRAAELLALMPPA